MFSSRCHQGKKKNKKEKHPRTATFSVCFSLSIRQIAPEGKKPDFQSSLLPGKANVRIISAVEREDSPFSVEAISGSAFFSRNAARSDLPQPLARCNQTPLITLISPSLLMLTSCQRSAIRVLRSCRWKRVEGGRTESGLPRAMEDGARVSRSSRSAGTCENAWGGGTFSGAGPFCVFLIRVKGHTHTHTACTHTLKQFRVWS